MNDLIDQLIHLLQEETEAFYSIFNILEKETSALLNSDLKLLNEIIKIKENEVLKIRLIEEQREKTVRLIARRLGWSASAVSLAKIAEKLSNSYSETLMGLSKKLQEFVPAVKAINHKNKKLVEHSLGLVRDSLSLLDNLLSPSPVYHQNGRFDPSSMHAGRLICSTI